MKLKVKDNENFVKDTETKAVLNTDLTSLEAYRAHRNKQRQKDNEIERLKEDVKEIKDILQLLVEKIK
jgi:archaellum component FlaC